MEAIEFIKENLRSFIKLFTKTKVSYEYFEQSDTHFIEILPNNIYRLDSDYINWESDFFDLFIAKYPDQNICFISDDALVGLDNIHFELTGCQYLSHSISSNSKVSNIPNYSIIFSSMAQGIITPEVKNANKISEKINSSTPTVELEGRYPMAA